MTTSAVATDLAPDAAVATPPPVPTAADHFDWDHIADSPFNIGAHTGSMRVGEWWVHSGMHVRLPANMLVRPAGTSKLLVVANTLSGPGGRNEVDLDGLSDVLLFAHDIQLNSVAAYRSLPADGTFRMATIGHHFAAGTDFHLSMRGGEHNGRRVVPQGYRWYHREPDQRVVEHYLAGPLPGDPGVERYGDRRLPLPDIDPAFDTVARTFLARLLLTAHAFFDTNRVHDAYRALERLESILALRPNTPSWQAVLTQCFATRELFEPQLHGSHRVPALTPAVYSRVAGSYKTALQAFADRFETFVDRSVDVAQRQQAARLMLRQQEHALQFQAQVIEHLEENLNAATRNLEAAQTSLDAQSQRVDAAQREFDVAIEAWQRRQQQRANLAIVSAVFTGVVALGKLFAGKPTNVAEAAEEMTRAAKKAAKLAATLAKLAKIIQAVTAMVKMIRAILPAVNRARSAAALAASMAEVRREAQLNLQGAPSESAYWDQFCVEIKFALQPALDANIPKASEYLQQLQIFIIYGRALTDAQAALPPIAQELAQANLLTKLAEEQYAGIEEQIHELKEDAPPALAAHLWLRHRSVRRAMFSALVDHDAAYRYWALDTTRVPPSPHSSIRDMVDDLALLADMEAASARALVRFSDPPIQEFNHFPLQVPADALQDLLRDGSFILRLTPQFSPLSQFGDIGRARVTEVAVWVIWADEQRPRTMEFTVRTDGDYYDQLAQWDGLREFRFLGPRINQMFAYDTARAEAALRNHRLPNEAITVPARVARAFASQFSEPTLFTNWRFSLPSSAGEIPRESIEALVERVKGIVVEFSGTFIKDADRF